jgi:hemerythrin superfamily protein
MTPTKSNVPAQAQSTAQSAIALLTADHEAVNQMFTEYQNAPSVSKKRALVAELCSALSVHMQIEEEIFYPAVKTSFKDKLLVSEAKVEHAGVRDLITQIEGIEPDGEMYDAKVKVLSEYLQHHVKEEQNEMFPQVQSSSLDLAELGARLAARKDELLAQPA